MSRSVASLPLFTIAALVGCLWLEGAPVAHACGGFFCGQQPVDQTAERILFKVGPNAVTMVVQIAYAGDAPDFAWVLPLADVPDVKSLGLFPQRALSALDANTGPRFEQPDACLARPEADFARTTSPTKSADAGTSVTVHFRAEVGPYDVAAIESPDPMELFEWLRTNTFNVKETMLPYIRSYTEAGMKFIALKLKPGSDSTDIQPFRFDLPGQTPSIPLRMTALAAEPEMGILVFVFGDGRYGGANWPDVEIRNDRIVQRFDGRSQTNWTALVARGVDEAGGQGWVTELAGSTQPLLTALSNSGFRTMEDEMAAQALTELIGDARYITRLYSRLSAEEMTVDPVFKRTGAPDVSNVRKLSEKVDGIDQCVGSSQPPDPCLFTSCGAGGICRPVMMAGNTAPVAGCACVGGSAARTTFDPAGLTLQTASGTAPAAAVACQDVRLSFVNPGDKIGDVEMGDPCTGFDCGPNGSCAAVNMTPTCVCDRGFVAVGGFASDGSRTTQCRAPMIEVPDKFYAQRLPDLPADLPGGRAMEVDTSLPIVKPRMDDLGSGGGVPVEEDDGCSVSQRGNGAATQGWLWIAAAMLAIGRRRRSRPRC